MTQNFGFVIDNRSCIGCHACSTACKSENEVPLGVYRTWVKTTEVGAYPDSKRLFQVTRCNHCANPPCVRICPTEAMVLRDDGIVEFDHRNCIGCKACMQACPYDAIYIDPESHTAAKCHYCSHRTDIGLEPACVVVCPEHAIIAGDMADPNSEISRILASEEVSVRKPEQGTEPKLFYIEGDEVNLRPTLTERAPTTFAATDVMALHDEPGPIRIGGTTAGHMVQVGYNAQHQVPWHWPVSAYLVTKGIAAGIVLVLLLLWGVMGHAVDPGIALSSATASLLFIVITSALLVFDLERPERFYYILLRPQWRSWLTRGAVLLIAFSTLTGLWAALEWGASFGLVAQATLSSVRMPLLWLAAPFAVGTAIYTAFLFAQAEGRDLWQSPLLAPHLLVQALLAGAALLAIFWGFGSAADALRPSLLLLLGGLLVADLALLAAEFSRSHATDEAKVAAAAITHGRYARRFRLGVVVAGHLLPLALCFVGAAISTSLAGCFALAGLAVYEWIFVRAPQEVPNS
jgi:Fe-S-cluster-containing dehydrogenase component/formate-dependent nitrite reductase membrane component NrfD